jgi:hypothetical protein
MLDIVRTANSNGNGNGADSLSGRGIKRRKLTQEERVSLAADIAMGEVHVTPSLKQTAAATGVSVVDLRKELKERESAHRVTSIWNAWDHATDQERETAIRIIGVADVWDVLARVVG